MRCIGRNSYGVTYHQTLGLAGKRQRRLTGLKGRLARGRMSVLEHFALLKLDSCHLTPSSERFYALPFAGA